MPCNFQRLRLRVSFKTKDGTTALLGLLRHNTLHMGWVGDSRCILSRQVVGPKVCVHAVAVSAVPSSGRRHVLRIRTNVHPPTHTHIKVMLFKC